MTTCTHCAGSGTCGNLNFKLNCYICGDYTPGRDPFCRACKGRG